MKFTRAIALCGLALAIALAIGAISPMQPYASAGNLQPIFSSAPERARPTPALATAAPTEIPPVAVQLPPTPQVIYIQLPPPQVVYVQSPAEIPTAAPEVVYVEVQAAAPVVDEVPAAAPVVDQSTIPGTPEFNAALAAAYNSLPTIQCPCESTAEDEAASDAYQRRRLESGARPRTR